MSVVRTLLIIISLLLGWAAVRTEAVAHMIALADAAQSD